MTPKESAWHHDSEEIDWKEISEDHFIDYSEPLTGWHILRECLCFTICVLLLAIICIGVCLL
jgi:hypothetical protein